MKQYPGYTLVKREDCPEQHGTQIRLIVRNIGNASPRLEASGFIFGLR